MNWDAFHTRGEVLRNVVDEANTRRDGALPLELPGVAEAFDDELALVAALQLRWHTRLSGQIERSLMEQPMDLESAVLRAWRRTASELVGVREILDAYGAEPTDPGDGRALSAAHRKEWVLLAAMAGQASASDGRAARVGQKLENKARYAFNPPAAGRRPAEDRHPASILDRLKGAPRGLTPTLQLTPAAPAATPPADPSATSLPERRRSRGFPCRYRYAWT